MIPAFKAVGLPNPSDQFVIQFDKSGNDLVVRVRWINLVVRTAVSQLALTSEHRLYGGRDKPAEEIREWLRQVAADSYCLAHVAVCKKDTPLSWPSGWPVPPYEIVFGKVRHQYGLRPN